MKILFLTIGDEEIASSRVRVLQYLPYLKNLGIHSKVLIRSPYILIRPANFLIRIIQHIHIQFNMLKFFIYALFYKILFIQKVYFPKYFTYLFVLMGKKIIFDFDDAIYTSFNQKDIKKRKISRLEYVIKKASLVVIENDINKEYSEQFNKNVIIITGPIECTRYKPALNNTHKKVIIGWIGSPNSSIYLNLLEQPLKELSKKFPGKFELLLIGAPPISFTGVDINIQPWTMETETELLNRFDIGIMPLFDDPWSHGKGGYKILQYMAIGIPTVASPISINSILVKHGDTGYLAANDEEWVKYLEDLLLNEQKRKEFGMKARQLAMSDYSFEYYSGILVNEIKKLSSGKIYK